MLPSAAFYELAEDFDAAITSIAIIPERTLKVVAKTDYALYGGVLYVETYRAPAA